MIIDVDFPTLEETLATVRLKPGFLERSCKGLHWSQRQKPHTIFYSKTRGGNREEECHEIRIYDENGFWQEYSQFKATGKLFYHTTGRNDTWGRLLEHQTYARAWGKDGEATDRIMLTNHETVVFDEGGKLAGYIIEQYFDAFYGRHYRKFARHDYRLIVDLNTTQEITGGSIAFYDLTLQEIDKKVFRSKEELRTFAEQRLGMSESNLTPFRNQWAVQEEQQKAWEET